MEYSELFITPQNGPVFNPTKEEWEKGPAYYINSIRSEAEPYGICKIIPPSSWKPPFNMKLYNNSFVPRIQRPYELNPIFRCRQLFFTKLNSFWIKNGFQLKIPIIANNQLDLYNLFHAVRKSGGFIPYSHTDFYWTDISKTVLNDPNFGMKLCEIFTHLLLPYSDVDLLDKTVSSPYLEKFNDDNYEVSEAPQKIKGNIYGNENLCRTDKEPLITTRKSVFNCHICQKRMLPRQNEWLRCSFCATNIHKKCSVIVFDSEKHVWACLKCLSKGRFEEETYGFTDSKKSYKLMEFAEYANELKRKYFEANFKSGTNLTTELIENEFWKISMSEGEHKKDQVVVEYGTDLHAVEFGSGFSPDVPKYVESEWNLNNLGIIDSSALSLFTETMSGVRVPWCYVGMCFSCFCWHVEDHWSYSVNYQHWGDVKTWYGVGRRHADKFEALMKEILPELFDQSRDLMNHLTTLLNPAIMIANGIDVCKIDQNPGEFVITFPRGYHGGFNQGLNFNEAVNYCPPDWMPIGRECIAHNANFARECVFSHDEVVCRLSIEKNINPDFAIHCATDLRQIKQAGVDVFYKSSNLGIKHVKRVYLELLADQERICCKCRTVCFLWSFSCPCDTNMVCHNHVDDLCDCDSSSYTLNYRYEQSDLEDMVSGVDKHISNYQTWKIRMFPLFSDETKDERMTLREMETLHAEAKEFGFYKALEQFSKESVMQSRIDEARDIVYRCRRIFESSRRDGGQVAFSDVQMMREKIPSVRLKMEYSEKLENLLKNVKSLRESVSQIFKEGQIDVFRVEELLSSDIPFDKVSISEFLTLQNLTSQYKWLRESYNIFNKEISLPRLAEFLASEKSPERHESIQARVGELSKTLWIARGLEDQTRVALQGDLSISEVEQVIGEDFKQPILLPQVATARKAIGDAKLWLKAYGEVMNGQLVFPFDIFEEMHKLGKTLPIKIKEFEILESCVKENRAWKAKASKFVLKKNSRESLLSVLWPSSPDGETAEYFKKVYSPDKKLTWDDLTDLKSLSRGSISLLEVYKQAKKVEMEAIKTLRMFNLEKRNHHRLKPSQFCVCQKSPNNEMLVCSICNDLFHENCASNSLRQGYASIRGSVHQSKDKFVCMKCCRTRRPRLDNVINLLVELQRSTVRLPEGELIQCIAEMMISWQSRVNRLLSKEQVVEVLKRSGSFNVQSSPPSLVTLNQLTGINDLASEQQTFGEEKGDLKQGRRSQRKAQLVPRQFDCSSKELNQYDLSCLEELMVEGDLSQIDSDEAEKLWEVIVLSRGKEKFFFTDVEPEPRAPAKKEPVVKPKGTRGRKRRLPNEEVVPRKPRKQKIKRSVVVEGAGGTHTVNVSSDSFDGDYNYDEEDVICDSLNCMYPVGPVDWISCANCNARFHTICVPDTNIDYMCDYYCAACIEEFDNLKPTPGLFGEDFTTEYHHSPPVNTPSGVCLYTMEDDDDGPQGRTSAGQYYSVPTANSDDQNHNLRQ